MQLPTALLSKCGKLNKHEHEIVKLHTIYGFKILESVPNERGKFARTVSLFHHERFDGQGYWGVKSSELPPYVGIVSICDVYVALRSARCYKTAWSKEEALAYVQNHAGTQFCPKLVEIFLSMERNGLDYNYVNSV